MLRCCCRNRRGVCVTADWLPIPTTYVCCYSIRSFFAVPIHISFLCSTPDPTKYFVSHFFPSQIIAEHILIALIIYFILFSTYVDCMHVIFPSFFFFNVFVPIVSQPHASSLRRMRVNYFISLLFESNARILIDFRLFYSFSLSNSMLLHSIDIWWWRWRQRWFRSILCAQKLKANRYMK